jgi:lysophospholipase L1-like esterase
MKTSRAGTDEPGAATRGATRSRKPIKPSKLRGRVAAAAVAMLAVISLIGGYAAVGGRLPGSAGSASSAGAPPAPSDGLSSSESPAAGGTAIVTAATDSPSGSASATPGAASASPVATAAKVPLPALLAAIGDSYSQAWSVSPKYLYDHPQFSWVVGTNSNDGVSSILERLRALGASPIVVDAATSGRKMSDAVRQAGLVAAAARRLPAGKSAYVTFELGTNDLCASPEFMTDPAVFTNQLQTAMTALKAALPAGSRILMLSIPNFPHFREITQADAAAKALLSQKKNLNRCAPYLGTFSESALTRANAYLGEYDAALEAACADVDTHPGKAGRLHCTYNAGLLGESDFSIKDLSTADYFHPSLSGQARMAANGWRAGIWSTQSKP